MCVGDNATVPSAPRHLHLSLVEEDPPVVHLTWQAPVLVHGSLTGYQLIYGVRGEDIAEQRNFDADKHRFTTTFLGIYLYVLSLCFVRFALPWTCAAVEACTRGQPYAALVCRLMVYILHPHNPCKHMDYYSFTDPGVMEGSVGLAG